jgi:hypothetical protein
MRGGSGGACLGWRRVEDWRMVGLGVYVDDCRWENRRR